MSAIPKLTVGTSASFHLVKPSSSSFRTRILINGTSPSSTQESLVTANSTSSSSIHNLPKGLHQLELQINQGPLGSLPDDYLTFQGVTLGQGTILSATTLNQTIDDSAWANGTITLSPGWNMLEKDHSNWINTVSDLRADEQLLIGRLRLMSNVRQRVVTITTRSHGRL